MRIMLWVHVIAAGLALVSGFVALYAPKGERLHRKSGMLFVYTMLTMSLLGALMAAMRASLGSVIGGSLAAYLVITALTTVRPAAAGSRWLNPGLMVVALALGLTCVTWGFQALATPTGSKDGVPAGMFFVFGAIALLAGVSDIRVIRSGGLQGVRRLTRHLWRMCFALFIASGSYFLGPSRRIPETLRIPALRAFLGFLPLLMLLYWLWRVRSRQRSRRTTARLDETLQARGQA